MLRIKYLLISVFLLNSLSIFGMEEIKNGVNAKTKLLDYKSKNLVAVAQVENSNKISLDEFIKKLPNEIWREIISFLKYEDNRQIIIKFLVQAFFIDDFTAKKIAIDLYRTALINSKSLTDFKNITKNTFNSWKNQDNKKLVKDYLKTLNMNFKKDINYEKNIPYEDEHFDDKVAKLSKEEIVLKALDFKIEKLIEYSNFFRLSRHKIRCSPFELSSEYFRLSYLVKKHYCVAIVILVPLFILGIAILIGYLYDFGLGLYTALMDIPLFFLAGVAYFVTKDYLKGIQIKINRRSAVFNELNKRIKKYLEDNKVVIADSDNYFLKLLGYEDRDEDITYSNFV